jgi:hypothetical protein
MTTDACRDWRGTLASAALGPLAEPEAVGLRAHLDGCRACRRELAELTAVARMLPAADIERVVDGPVEPSRALAERVLDGVARERGRRRVRRYRLAALAAAAVIALIVGTGIVATTEGGHGPTHTNVVFTSRDEGSARATLTPRREGTEVALTVSGLHHGDWYWLWLTGADGKRIPAGSFEGGAPSSHLRLIAALPLDRTRRIWMTDRANRVVFDARLPRPA